MDDESVDLASRPAQRLLAYLLLNREVSLSRERLAGMLWGDSDERSARKNLRNTLYRLRKVIGERYLDSDKTTISFDSSEPFWLDVAVLEESADGLDIEALVEAVSVYRGELLPGFYEDWVLLERERLRALFERQMGRLLERLLAAERWEEVVTWGERWLAHGGTPEPAYRALMLAHGRVGDTAAVVNVYQRCRDTLREELGLDPSEQTRETYDWLLKGGEDPAPAWVRRLQSEGQPEPVEADEPVHPRKKQAPSDSLPVRMTTFIGRQRELAQVKGYLKPTGEASPKTRLLTLTGTGGAGKTSLALQAASDLTGEFKGGVFFVDLAPVERPELVASTITRALGLVEAPDRSIEETLKQYLRDRQLLLVLDNFEHLIEASPLVSELLLASPELHLLVTSREILRLSGEQIYPVPPLAVPPLDNGHSEPTLLQYESVQLFFQRAKAAKADFELSEENAGAVAEICVRLDGLPLAIELAAARVRLFSPGALRDQLSDRFRILGAGPRDVHERQRTLQAALDWSYKLLSQAEKKLFARLSVFQGGGDVEAIQQVCSQDLGVDILEGLESLVDQSLLQQRTGSQGTPRFFFLETVLFYAREKLDQMGELEAMRQRHAAYYLSLAEQAEPHLFGGPGWASWTRRIEREHDNLRSVLAWAFKEGKNELGVRIVGAIYWFWYRKGYYSDWQRWIHLALERRGELPVPVRAKLYLGAGALAYAQQEPQHSKGFYRKALEMYRDLGDGYLIARSLLFLGIAHIGQEEGFEEGVSLCENGLALFRKLGDKAWIAQALNALGEVLRAGGDYDRAREVYEESLQIAHEIGDQLREHMMYLNLSFVALQGEDIEAAEGYMKAGLATALEIDLEAQVAVTLAVLAGLVTARGQYERAAKLMGTAERLQESLGFVLQPGDQFEYDRYNAVVREGLGEAAYQRVWSEGQQMALEGLDRIVAFALEKTSSSKPGG